MNNINLETLLPDDLSDECAYHLIQFFHHFACVFEGMHFGKALRYEKAIINAHHPCCEKPFDDEEKEEPF